MTEKIMKTDDKRCRRTKAAIKSALLKLLKEKPLAKITVSELSTAADVNRKTFYNHYTDLNGVLFELENDAIERVFQLLDKDNIWNDIENPPVFFKNLFDIISDNMTLTRLLVQSGEHIHLMFHFREKLRTQWGDQLYGRKVDKQTLTLLMDFVAAGVLGIFESWAKDPDNTDLKELARITGIMVEGASKPIVIANLEN